MLLLAFSVPTSVTLKENLLSVGVPESDVEVVASAFRSNKVELFATELHRLFKAQPKLEVPVRRIVEDLLDAIGSGNIAVVKIFRELHLLAALAVLTPAFWLRDQHGPAGLAFVAFFLVYLLKQSAEVFVQTMAQVKVRVCGAQSLQLASTEEQSHSPTDNAWTRFLCLRAGCSKKVTPAVRKKQVSLYAVGSLYCVVKQTGDMCDALIGRFRCRQGKVGPFTADHARTTLVETRQVLTKLESVVANRVVANKTTRKVASLLDDQLNSLIILLQEGEKRTLKAAFLGHRKDRQANRTSLLFGDVGLIVRKILTEAKKLEEMEKEDIDMDGVNSCCRNMQQMLASSKPVEDDTAQRVQEAIDIRNKKREAWAEKDMSFFQAQNQLATHMAHKESRTSSFLKHKSHLILAEENAKIKYHKTRICVKPRSMWHHTPIEKSILEKWQSLQTNWTDSKFADLCKISGGNHSSGGFLFSVDAVIDSVEKLEEQRLLKQDWDNALKKLEEFTQEHFQQEKESADCDKAISECQSQIEQKKWEAEEAKKDWQKSQQQGEEAWLTFHSSCPIESAEVDIMVKMSDMMKLSAIHMVEDEIKLGELQSLLKMLQRITEDESDFNVTDALYMALKAKDIVSNPEVSPIGFLLALSEADLSKALQPNVTGESKVEELLNGFQAEVDAVKSIANGGHEQDQATNMPRTNDENASDIFVESGDGHEQDPCVQGGAPKKILVEDVPPAQQKLGGGA